jgi:hypothetical protein
VNRLRLRRIADPARYGALADFDCGSDPWAREVPDHTSAAVAYQEFDPESFGGLFDVTVVSCESDVTLERLYAGPVTLECARAAA